MEFSNFCQGSHSDNFPLKTLTLGWVASASHSLTFQLKCLDFQSNQYKKLAPVLSSFCNGLCITISLQKCTVIDARGVGSDTLCSKFEYYAFERHPKKT